MIKCAEYDNKQRVLKFYRDIGAELPGLQYDLNGKDEIVVHIVMFDYLCSGNIFTKTCKDDEEAWNYAAKWMEDVIKFIKEQNEQNERLKAITLPLFKELEV